MMNKIYKHLLVASLLMMGGTAMAQTLISAYFTDDYKFRHDMNPAFENKAELYHHPSLGQYQCQLARKLRLSGYCDEQSDVCSQGAAKPR